MSGVSVRLRGRAAAFKQDALYASREAENCAGTPRLHEDARLRERTYRMVADELLMLADELADWSATDATA